MSKYGSLNNELVSYDHNHAENILLQPALDSISK